MADAKDSTRARRAPKDFGPVQCPAQLGIPAWAFESLR
jgi:hypothetical protein